MVVLKDYHWVLKVMEHHLYREQSGGQIEVQLSGNNEFQFLNGGRFRVTRTGVPAYISRGPVTGVTVDHGSTTSVQW